MCGEKVDNDAKREPDVRQRKPGEDERENVVLATAVSIRHSRKKRICTYEGLDVEEEHAKDAVAGTIQVEEVDDRVLDRVMSFYSLYDGLLGVTYHRSCERTVQPPTPLTDELRSRLRDIRFSLTRLDVRQRPAVVRFRDELETEDTILGQEHVLREDIHAVDTLGAQAVGERVVTVEVLLERSAEDGAEAIRGEGTRQD